MSCDALDVQNKIKPVSLIRVQEDKTLIVKTEYIYEM